MKEERGFRYKEKLSNRLFASEEERGAFLYSLGELQKSPALYWRREKASHFLENEKPKFLPDFVSFLDESERPGRHDAHHSGDYYVVDQSSVFLTSVMMALEQTPSIILDACASPGGKSIFSSLYFEPELLISNEVVEKRAKALISNFSRCKIQNALVTSQSTQSLSQALKSAVDLVVLDVPCSGQSLIVKGEEVDNPFHPATVSMNAMRQRKILTECSEIVAPTGHMLYLTCTFSLDENEKNIDWFLKKNPHFTSINIPHLEFLRSNHSKHHCYRIYPHQGFGAGGFACLLTRIDKTVHKEEPCLEALRVFWRSTQ